MVALSALDRYYANEADRIDRGPQLYGGNAAIVSLRCFKYYHPDQGSWLTAPDGKERWVGPKTSRIYAILMRDGGTDKLITMAAVAREAFCSTSTVSRAILRLQAFGFLAIDVFRGRNGGMRIRRRYNTDSLRHYAAAAWRRIRSALNVASRSSLNGMDRMSTPNVEDATFSGPCEHAGRTADEYREWLLAGTYCDCTPARITEADREWAKANDWAAQVIAERQRLDRDEPDWDAHLELIRASIGWPSAI